MSITFWFFWSLHEIKIFLVRAILTFWTILWLYLFSCQFITMCCMKWFKRHCSGEVSSGVQPVHKLWASSSSCEQQSIGATTQDWIHEVSATSSDTFVTTRKQAVCQISDPSGDLRCCPPLFCSFHGLRYLLVSYLQNTCSVATCSLRTIDKCSHRCQTLSKAACSFHWLHWSPAATTRGLSASWTLLSVGMWPQYSCRDISASLRVSDHG